ncbi:MAG TPA: DUF1540 domain-containing protein [Bacillota bacterium]
MTKVKCTVNSCEFWEEGQVCGAGEILVKNDIAGAAPETSNHYINANMEVAGDLDEAKVANTSPQTCCDTMRPKGRDKSGNEAE